MGLKKVKVSDSIIELVTTIRGFIAFGLFNGKSSKIDLGNILDEVNTEIAKIHEQHSDDETATSILAKIGDGSKISSSYLPSYVDDVVEYDDFESLPAIGEAGKIYITLSDNKTYRWSGSVYIGIGGGSYVFTGGLVETGGIVTLGISTEDSISFGNNNSYLQFYHTDFAGPIYGEIIRLSASFSSIGGKLSNISFDNALFGTNDRAHIHLYSIENGNSHRLGFIIDTSVDLDTSSFIVIDEWHKRGLQEAADYSGNKTDYCYATKKMVSKICTADFNLQSGETALNNTCIYHKIYVSTGKSVTKAKIMVNGCTTTNDITIKLYDDSKNEVANAVATITPAVDSSLHVLEGNFGAGIQLSDNTFYWIGIHQASGGGASLVDIANARSNSEWNTGVSGAGLASVVPAGTATDIRICIELI